MASNQVCSVSSQCFTCFPGDGCYPVNTYQRLVVSEHGTVVGRNNIKAELYKRGPVSCGIAATAGLEKYTVRGWVGGGERLRGRATVLAAQSALDEQGFWWAPPPKQACPFSNPLIPLSKTMLRFAGWYLLRVRPQCHHRPHRRHCRLGR